MDPTTQLWIDAVKQTVASYRRMIDGCVGQLSDAELQQGPADAVNSVANILRHLGGNLRSRWTEFLTTDGEKPDRDRETEFADWAGDRQSLLQHFDAGWTCLTAAIESLDASNLTAQVLIRGEAHTIPQAIERSITHIAYHAGQIAMIARMVHNGDWQWLTVEPRNSESHNQQTWGTSASRSVFGAPSEEE